jgi:hypothetical protein
MLKVLSGFEIACQRIYLDHDVMKALQMLTHENDISGSTSGQTETGGTALRLRRRLHLLQRLDASCRPLKVKGNNRHTVCEGRRVRDWCAMNSGNTCAEFRIPRVGTKKRRGRLGFVLSDEDQNARCREYQKGPIQEPRMSAS